MDLNESNCYYLNSFSEKLAKERKTVFFHGDFNVDLLKYLQYKATNEFLDSQSSNMFVPYIIQLTRITSYSESIIDNIFSNYISQEVISGNLKSTISDHLPQFLIAPCIFSNAPDKKSKILIVTGLNSIVKSSFLTILIHLSKTFLTPWVKFLTSMLH